MQPPPRQTPPNASGGPPPSSGGANAFRRTRPHKHGAAVATAAMATVPQTQPMTDPFAVGRQAMPPLASHTPPPINNHLPAPPPGTVAFPQSSPLLQSAPPSASGVSLFTPQPMPVQPTEQAYFNSRDAPAYVSHNSPTGPLQSATPPAHSIPFQAQAQAQASQPMPWMHDHGSRPPSVQNYFQPTNDNSQPFLPPPSGPSPHPMQQQYGIEPPEGQPPPQHHQHHQQHLQQNSLSYEAQGYLSQPQVEAVPYSQPVDTGTLGMFFGGNDVENIETPSGDTQVNGVAHPGGHIPEQVQPVLGAVGGAAAGAQFDTVENLECVPNLEVLPNEPQPPAHAYETGPNLETPDQIPRPARSASVSSCHSNVSHHSGRHQGMVGTFIQQESVSRSHEPGGVSASPSAGYFEQIDTASDLPSAAAFPTPSPPKPVGVFQASANSSFEPVRSHLHPVAQMQPVADRARVVVERSSSVTSASSASAVADLPGNLEQPPDDQETQFLPGSVGLGGDRSGQLGLNRPASRRMCDSPATTLWAPNNTASLSSNILLAPAAPPLAVSLVATAATPADVIQPPEDGPLDLQRPPQPSENLENPPDHPVLPSPGPPPQASPGGYASLLVSTPPAEALNQSVLIAPPSTNYSVIPLQSHPHPTGSPDMPRPPSLANQVSQSPHTASNQPQFFPQASKISTPASNQSPLNLAPESKEAVKPLPPLASIQSLHRDSQSMPSFNSYALPSSSSSSALNQNQSSNYELLDFSMHQSQSSNQASAPPPPQLANPMAQVCNPPGSGFYLQVTKDAQQQQGAQGEGDGGASTAPPTMPEHVRPPSVPMGGAQPAPTAMPNQQPPLPREPSASAPAQAPVLPPAHLPAAVPTPPPDPAHAMPPMAMHPPAMPNAAANPAFPNTTPVPPPGAPTPAPQPQPFPHGDPGRPPSVAGGAVPPPYGPPPPLGQLPGPLPGHGGYYGAAGYPPEYYNGRGPYMPPYGMPDPRAQQYHQDDPYRRADPRYPRYEAERQPERPSSRSSQYSERSHSSRQGYEEYPAAPRTAHDDYYAEYYKKQYADYAADRNRWYDAGYDPHYRGYYDQSSYNWYNYNQEAYRQRENYGYTYGQQYQNSRREGYDDPWRYYPGYDMSFEEDYRRQRDDEFDRRSVGSERSSHSVHSQSHSSRANSRRNSFSSHSQQSQVYRSQPDLVATAHDPSVSGLPLDYSSYNQYPTQQDYPDTSSWSTVEQPPPRPLTPEKFTVPHRCARFGAAGQLIIIQPNMPSAGQPALLEVHTIETLMQDSSEQMELRSFPGPLIKEETHKVDVIKFAQNKAIECMRSDILVDKYSACLIWEFIVLMCRQNGTVVGTDIADLLLREHRSVWLPGKSPNEANLIDFNNEAVSQPEETEQGALSLISDTFMVLPDNVGKETERFRELLLFGRKKDALESAMKNGLWGHALLLASKMDSRTHARVMTQFANSLPINDPLQTVYQLMSGRMPAAATCCGDEKWGDWRPHLAMVLSNLTQKVDLDMRTIATMGDTLASKGLVDAAHFCYLMAQVGLGVFTKKSTKMVLIGSNHSLSFDKFCTSEAIQRTEAYEYAQSLGSQPLSLPNFQVFKFIYACRLAESGLCAQAFHYCEVVSRALLTQSQYHSVEFVSQLIEMSARLRFYDPQLKEKPEQELFMEPDWLLQLRQLDRQIKGGEIMFHDRGTPQLYPCSSPSSSEPPTPPNPSALTPDTSNPLMAATFMPGAPMPAVQLMPPAPPTILQDGAPPLSQSSDTGGFYPTVPTPAVPTFSPTTYQPDNTLPMPPPHGGPPLTNSDMPSQEPVPMHRHLPGQMPGHLPPQMPGQIPPHMPGQMPSPMPGQMAPSMPGQIPPPMPGQMPPGMPGQMPPSMPGQMPPSMPGQIPPPMPGQMPPSMPGHLPLSLPGQMQPPIPGQMQGHMAPPMPGQMPMLGGEASSASPSPQMPSLQPSQMDFYDHMAHLGPGRRSRTTSQSSMHMGPGRRSRTTSESSNHSTGRERSSSTIKQGSPAPPPIPEATQEAPKKSKKESPKKSGGGWLSWLMPKKNEAFLPDDKNKSIVWDEKKQRWVNQDEPEEESKPPPPPPSSFPKMGPGPGMARGPGVGPGMGPGMGPGSGPPVNMFSRRAGTKNRYVDVLNPGRGGGGGGGGPPAPMPAPADLFAPLAPMPIPPNLFTPNAAGEEPQPAEGNTADSVDQTQPQMFNPGQFPQCPEGSQSGELSRSSSMSSLSREVSQHLNQQAPPTGGVTFYNPAQFAQAAPMATRAGRLGGPREYPTLK